MNVFGKYAEFYDLLNQDKDYDSESQYVHGLIKKYLPGANTILELGCGTGVNAELMVRTGYEVHGVDISEEMLRLANEKKSKLRKELAAKLIFSQSDICALELPQCFDAVISLFHVASYQTSNKNLMDMFKTAARHLDAGGIFVFDFWYGPAVLTDLPEVRIKRVEDDRLKIIRITEPVMHPNDNTIDVNFQFIVFDKATKKNEVFQETHKMRYLFAPELEFMLSIADFQIEKKCEWLSDKELGLESWNGVCVAKKR